MGYVSLPEGKGGKKHSQQTSGWEDFGGRFLMPAEEEPNERKISWRTEVHIVCLFTGCLMFGY